MSKKLAIVVLLAVLALGTSNVMATASRMETLGQTTGLAYVQDDTSIFSNPATVGYYGNAFMLHLGGVDAGGINDLHAFGGVTANLGKMLTLGLVFARNPSYEEGIIGSVLSPVLGVGTLGIPGGSGAAFQNNWQSSMSSYYFGYNNYATFPVSLTGVKSPPGLQDEAMNWENPIDVLLALNLGKLHLGIGYYNANGSATSKITQKDALVNYNDYLAIISGGVPSGLGDIEDTIKEKASLNAIKVGLSADLGKLMPELWVHIVPFSIESEWKHKQPLTTIPFDSYELNRKVDGTRFNVGFRMFTKLSDNWTIVPAVEWGMVQAKVKFKSDPNFDPTGYSLAINTALASVYPGWTGTYYGLPILFKDETDLREKYTANSVKAGLGINRTMEKLLFAGSIGMQWSQTVQTLEVSGIKGKVKNEFSYLALPVVSLGLEYQATKVLALRGGIKTTTIYGKITEKSDADNGDFTFQKNKAKASVTTQDTQAAVGVGLHFGNLVIDLTAGNEIIAGEEGSNNLFSHLDMKYKF